MLIKLEVGIEDWLQLIFEVDARNYDIKGIIVGKYMKKLKIVI